jgi:hypothetical protein
VLPVPAARQHFSRQVMQRFRRSCRLYNQCPISLRSERGVRKNFNNILLNPKAIYHVHKSPPLVPILSQINLVHTTPSYFSKTHFCTTLPLSLFLPGFPNKILYAILFVSMRVTFPAHHILLNFIIRIIFCEEHKI